MEAYLRVLLLLHHEEKMSDIYKEAIADAAKIRDIAEQDAKNAILEQISPYIKKMIMAHASNVLLEQEEPISSDASVAPEASAASSETVPSEVPVKATGEDNGEKVNVTMGASSGGKPVIDFDDLFADKPSEEIVSPEGMDTTSSMDVETVSPPIVSTGSTEAVPPASTSAEPPSAEPPATDAGPPPAPETAGAAAEEEVTPNPVAPAPLAEIKTAKQFERQLAEMAVKIDRIYTTKVSALTKDAYKTKLFSLLEQLDKLAANKAMTPRQAQLNENRLEFLFLHLKEANLNNSYKTKDKDTTMTTLKEFAAKLFESADEERLAQDSKSSGETGVPVHKKATAHAQKVDGVQADLFSGGSKTVETRHAAAGSVDASELEGLEGEEGAWEEALMEEIQAALRDELDAHEERPEELPSAVKDSGYFEINEAALRKAVAKLREGRADTKPTVAGMDEDMVLSVELPSEVEEQLADEDLSVDLMFSGEEDEEMGAEEEVVDLDMSSDEEGEDMGSEEEEMLLTDEEGEEEEEMEEGSLMESRRVRKALLEARTREVKARRLAEAKRAEAATLKTEMAETNLFLSKLVYLNKFLVREDLSRKVKQQIVEHLDRASTIAEAKDIYGKIVKKLDEAAAAQTAPVVGSASKPTTAGSARLNESVTRAATSGGSADPVIGTFDKWQILANIKKNG